MKKLLLLCFLMGSLILANAQTIIGTQPVNNATNVALDANIVLTFNSMVANENVNANNILVHGSQTGTIVGAFSGGDTTEITFDPANNFKPNETITISVTDGLGIVNPTVFSFITVGLPDPNIPLGQRYSKVQQLNLTMNLTVYATDLDSDGDLDIISASRVDNTVVWFENFGLRNFGSPQIISTEVNTPENVFAADLDGDGDMDVLSASQGDNKIAWYENDGSGNFGTQNIISTSANGARTVYAADLDGDGDMDVLSASINDDKIAWYENDGSGNFGTQQIISTVADGAFSVYAADIDGDGDMDVISGSQNDGKVAWYANDGFGNFGPQNIICSNCGVVWDVRAVDMDGDGDTDIISASFDDNNVRVFKNNGAGTFSSPIVLNEGFINATSINPTDLDGDGRMDIVASYTSSNKIVWFRQRPSGLFFAEGTTSSDSFFNNFMPNTLFPLQTFIGDIDGNQKLEVITASFSGGIHIYDTLPAANSQHNANIPTDRTRLDFIVAPQVNSLYINNENIRIHGSQTGYYNATFSLDDPSIIRILPDSPFKPGELVTIHVNNQVISGPESNFTLIAPVGIADSGEFISGENIISSQADGAIDVEAGDIDLDGDIDVVSISAIGNKIVWYPNDGSGNFGAEQIISTSINAGRGIFLADIDRDGDLDVISASFNDDKIAWYQNDGTGNFGPQIVISTQVNGPRKVIAADLDRDGDLDIITFTPDNSTFLVDDRVVWFANDGNGNFGSIITTAIMSIGESVTDIFVRDVNYDGLPDILVATATGAVALINSGVGFFNKTNIPLPSTTTNSNRILFHTPNSDISTTAKIVVGTNVNGGDIFSATTNPVFFSFGVFSINNNFVPVTGGVDQLTDILAADLTGNGNFNIVSASANDDKIAFYGNNNITQHIISLNADLAQSITAADLDGDGDMDVISASFNDDKIAWYENKKLPNLISTVPFNNANNIPLDASIDLTFSNSSINPNNNTIIVHGSQTGTIAGTFSGGGTNTITFNPTNNFKPGELITVSVTEGLDINNPTVFSFTTTVSPTSPGEFVDGQSIISTAADGARSVFSADLDGDGDLDVLSASQTDNKIAWYQNNGTGNFGAQQIISTAANGASSVFAADIDGDGVIDVLSASTSDNKIAWYQNDGTGNFGTQQIITTSANGVRSIYATDIDGDGDMDVLSASTNDDKIAWYENDGTGTFSAEQIISTIADFAFDVYAADIDNDGDMDVLSASANDDKIAWYANDGSGNFGAQQIISTAANSARSVYAADIDNDGDMDVLSASLDDDKIAWYQNNGDGTFGVQQIISTTANGAVKVYTSDLDGDGDMDVLSASFLDDKIAWYQNNGDSTFGSQQIISTQADGAASFYVADLDGDGDMDVLSASINDDKIAWYENVNNVSLLATSPTTNATNVALESNIVLTFDGAVANANVNANNILVHGSQTGTIAGAFSGGDTTEITFDPTNNFKPGETITVSVTAGLDITNPTVFSFTTTVSPDSPGQFVNGQSVISTSASGAQSVFSADLDGDGDLDVLSASSNDNKIAWYANDGTGNFGAQQIISTLANGASSVYAADIDGDGDMDVLSAADLDDKIAWYQNDGTGNFGTQQIITTSANGVRSIYATDIDGDGDLDVLSASSNDDKIAWYENDGTGTFSAEQIISTIADFAFDVYAADIDNDGDMDVLSASANDDKIAWYANDGSGNFGAQQIISTAANAALSVYAADIDGDGDMDVLSASNNDNKIAWYANDGAGGFGSQQIISTAANGARSIFAADIDGDGDMDVLSASSNDDKIAWYANNGSGNFGAQQIISTLADAAQSVFAADLDGDGDLDVLSASVFDDKIAWYKNDSLINTTWKGTTNTNWDVETNWTNGIPDANKVAVFPSVISNLPTVNIENAIASDILISSGHTLTIAAGKSLTIVRKLDNRGSFNILSDATSNGSLILEGTYIGESTVNYQRYVSDNWHIIAAPVKNMPLNGFKNSLDRSGVKYALAPYNNSLPSSRYEYYTDASGANNIDAAGNFIAGRGYSVKKTTHGILELSGSLNSENVAIQITDNRGTGGNKWNLVGNPYTASIAINSSAHETDNFLTLNALKLSPSKVAIYQWNSTNESYDIFNHATAEARYVAPGQGFFVEVKEGGETLTFSETLQSHQTGNLFSKNSDSTPQITLYLSENGVKKATQIKYLEQATTGLDIGFDAGTFTESNQNLEVFTHLISDSEGINFALQCLPNKDFETLIISVGINAKASANITFSIEALNLPSNLTIYLEDKKTNKFINLSEANYSITLTENTNSIGRFYLHTSSKTLSTESDFSSENISIYKIESNQIRVVGISTGKATVTLFNLLGKEIFKTQFEANSMNDISLPMMASGVYMVLVNTQSGSKTKKIILE